MTHTQEKILETFDLGGGASAQLVWWEETLWCGKIRFAENSTDEPDVEKLMEEFVALGDAELSPVDPEPGWDVCMSFNYLSKERPSGVFFGFLVQSHKQPEGFDMRWLPEGQYLKVEINEQTAKALESESWTGGEAGVTAPPFQWVSESLGPRLGFSCQDSELPIVEYYRHKDDGSIDGCWLYVPVQGKASQAVR